MDPRPWREPAPSSAPCPEVMIGSLAAVQLPDGTDDLQTHLFDRFAIEVPVIAWAAAPKRWIRVSAHIYNRDQDDERLAEALGPLRAGST